MFRILAILIVALGFVSSAHSYQLDASFNASAPYFVGQSHSPDGEPPVDVFSTFTTTTRHSHTLLGLFFSDGEQTTTRVQYLSGADITIGMSATHTFYLTGDDPRAELSLDLYWEEGELESGETLSRENSQNWTNTFNYTYGAPPLASYVESFQFLDGTRNGEAAVGFTYQVNYANVPEPGTAVGLALGLFVLGCRSRGKQI